jgi:anti-sigma-K factor RskA
MDVAELQKRLIAAARAARPRDDVPYAFERRILARLADRPLLDNRALWTQTLWRAVAPCLVIVLMLGVWASFQPGDWAAEEGLAADLESAVYAPLNDLSNGW